MKLLTLDYQGIAIHASHEAWFNATEIAALFGKRYLLSAGVDKCRPIDENGRIGFNQPIRFGSLRQNGRHAAIFLIEIERYFYVCISRALPFQWGAGVGGYMPAGSFCQSSNPPFVPHLHVWKRESGLKINQNEEAVS